jgi:hypothetical protein
MRAVLLSRSIRHIGANHASHRQNKTVKLPTRLNHFATLLVLCPLLAVADPEAELREAVSALSQTSYTWETTTRQRFTGDTTEPRINPNAPIEVRGRIDPAGYTEMTFMPSRDLPVPVTTLARDADVLAHTPVGWMRRSEMRQTAAADREVSFEGKTVRLSRFFTVALKATAQRTLTENLIDLITDLKIGPQRKRPDHCRTARPDGRAALGGCPGQARAGDSRHGHFQVGRARPGGDPCRDRHRFSEQPDEENQLVDATVDHADHGHRLHPRGASGRSSEGPGSITCAEPRGFNSQAEIAHQRGCIPWAASTDRGASRS